MDTQIDKRIRFGGCPVAASEAECAEHPRTEVGGFSASKS